MQFVEVKQMAKHNPLRKWIILGGVGIVLLGSTALWSRDLIYVYQWIVNP